MAHEIITAQTRKPWMEGDDIGNFRARQLRVRKGVPHPGSPHFVDHITVFLSGPVRVDCREYEIPDDETSRVLEAWSFEIWDFPWVVSVPKNVWHQISALTDEVSDRFCIFPKQFADADGVSSDLYDLERRGNG